MNILQIYPGKVWGGAEQYILNLIKSLEQRGHNIYTLCRGDGIVKDRSNAAPFDFKWKWSTGAARRLARYIDDNAIDVINIHDRHFIPIAVMARDKAKHKCRIVFTRHIARSQKIGLLERRMFRRLDAVIFVSQLAKDKLVAANPWIEQMTTYAILNSIPSRPESVKPSIDRNSYGIDDRTPVITFAGRVRKSKGVTTLLNALALCNDLPFHLLIIGKFRSERYRREVLKIIDKNNLNGKVTIVGFTDNVRGYIDISDIGVAPSIVVESCLLSNIEFMEAGKPIVTTNNGGQVEYVTDGKDGLLVEPGNTQQLAAAIRRLLTDTELRQHIGTEAKKTYHDKLQYNLFVDKIISAYNN